jgi:radical SAM-linked protein
MLINYIIKYRKTDRAIFLGHLDIMSCLQRAIRISKVPIAYSEGFNPHMKIATVSPLSLGVTGLNELLIIGFTKEVSMKDLELVNHNLPGGFRFTKCSKMLIGKKQFIGYFIGHKFVLSFDNKIIAKECYEKLLSLSTVESMTKKKIPKTISTLDRLVKIEHSDNNVSFIISLKESNNIKLKDIVKTINPNNSLEYSVNRKKLMFLKS